MSFSFQGVSAKSGPTESHCDTKQEAQGLLTLLFPWKKQLREEACLLQGRRYTHQPCGNKEKCLAYLPKLQSTGGIQSHFVPSTQTPVDSLSIFEQMGLP